MDAARLLGLGTSLVLHCAAVAVLAPGASLPSPADATALPPARVSIVAAELDLAEVPAPEMPAPRVRAPSELQIGGFRFDYGKIATRTTMLFPFFTRALALERTTFTAPRAEGVIPNKPFAPARTHRRTRPLVLTDGALQRLLDTSWSRRERWRPFRPIAALVAAHDPDDTRVVTVLRAYRDQNVLQPYMDTTIPDPRLWVMLGIGADHVNFIDFVEQYAWRHPSSKVTTELLFLLEEFVQGNFDTFCVLLDTRGHDLWWTRESSREAYDLFVALQQHYRVQLRKKNVSREELSTYYADVRLRILTHIVQTSPEGYRVNDALFLSGAIHWEHGRRTDALRTWRQMTWDPEDVYATAYSELRTALAHTTSADGRDVNALAISRVLSAENARWLASSARRLAHFGYTVDTF